MCFHSYQLNMTHLLKASKAPAPKPSKSCNMHSLLLSRSVNAFSPSVALSQLYLNLYVCLRVYLSVWVPLIFGKDSVSVCLLVVRVCFSTVTQSVLASYATHITCSEYFLDLTIMSQKLAESIKADYSNTSNSHSVGLPPF